MFRTLAITTAIAMALAALFVKHVYVEGDHIGFLVIAPSPACNSNTAAGKRANGAAQTQARQNRGGWWGDMCG